MKTALLILLAAAMPVSAFAERVLEQKSAEREEVRHSMIGYRNTLVFYIFVRQQAVLTVLVDNKDTSFPTSAKLYLFDESTREDALKKWVNNQHSDALFPDAPEPTSAVILPEDAVTVTAKEKKGESKGPRATYDDYKVSIKINDQAEKSKFKLTGFDDTVSVYVKKP